LKKNQKISGKNSIDQTFWDFWYPKRLVECIILVGSLLGYRVSSKLSLISVTIFHEISWIFTWFHEILHRFSPKFTKIHRTIQNMFEIVPSIPIIILKQPPPPIVPLPHLLKAVKLGSEPKNREIRPIGPNFFSSRPLPRSKNLG
jgi:hypothetical protein